MDEPDHNVIHDLCCYLSDAGMTAQAAMLLKQFVVDHPEQIWANVMLGKCLQKLDQHDVALEAFWQALDESPHLIGARFGAGISAMHVGQHKQALNHFKEVILINSKDARAYNLMGECCRALGLTRDAELFFAQARRLAPDFDAPIDNLLKLWDEQVEHVPVGAADAADDLAL